MRAQNEPKEPKKPKVTRTSSVLALHFDEQTPEAITVVASPIEVRVPAIAVLIEHREVDVAIRVDPRLLYPLPSDPTSVEYSSDCIYLKRIKLASIGYQVLSFLN